MLSSILDNLWIIKLIIFLTTKTKEQAEKNVAFAFFVWLNYLKTNFYGAKGRKKSMN
jgi:hypothetical protein